MMKITCTSVGLLGFAQVADAISGVVRPSATFDWFAGDEGDHEIVMTDGSTKIKFEDGKHGSDVTWTATRKGSTITDLKIAGRPMGKHLKGVKTACDAADEVVGKKIEFATGLRGLGQVPRVSATPEKAQASYPGGIYQDELARRYPKTIVQDDLASRPSVQQRSAQASYPAAFKQDDLSRRALGPRPTGEKQAPCPVKLAVHPSGTAFDYDEVMHPVLPKTAATFVVHPHGPAFITPPVSVRAPRATPVY